ncbi:MAG: GTPase Era [Clostridia bacterium]|nr:GTPase Era [Clostridia bacterium]
MKSGIVAVVGRANAGKSTLINVLVGEKVAIVSPKPQTTRERILGVLTRDDYQIVFEDTPGIYKASSLLNERMQKSTELSVRDVDMILFVIDAHDGLKQEDLANLKKYAKGQIPLILALSKTDIMPKENIPELVRSFDGFEGINKIVSLSARRGKNIAKLVDEIVKLLPEGEKIYEQDIVSDRSERFMIAEIMREKILLKYDKEIPHGVAIVVNVFEKQPNGVYDVNLDIVCEKQNHKAILIGKQGQALKEVSSFARQSMEKFLGAKVFLTVYVKVKSDWRNDPTRLKEFGYGENELF